MKAKIAVLASVVLCGSVTAEPAKYAVDALATGTQLNRDDAAASARTISEADEEAKAATERPLIEPTMDEKATDPKGDQIEPTGDDEKANIGVVRAPLAPTSAAAVSSSGWEAGAYGFFAGLLAIALRTCAAVIYRRGQRAAPAKGQALLPRANFIEAPALPMTGRALSPDAALARIEEIRRSLLDLTSSHSLAPSATAWDAMLPIAAAKPRSVERVVEAV